LKIYKNLLDHQVFFKQKAKRLKDFTEYLKNNYQGNLDNFFDRDINTIRDELLSLNGIGPETADSIILYAGNKSIFVVDAYTKRICERLPLDTNITYQEIQQFFQKNLCNKFSNQDIPKVYNELHAQIVILAKNYCKKNPECDKCPLNKYCSYKN